MSHSLPHYRLGDKYDLINASSPTESPKSASTSVTPIQRRRNHLSSRLAELNEEFLLENESS